ncbi:DUF4097 and DUF4098 domain-containing protein YvlB [Paenibacillus sp. DS2015]|uniref:DUF4097 family beta strand repeat-containing protein n=1 Tax=Paenibacillus sp. DS2015 TaxID=3373917 RepID=UPI003D19544B
MMAKKSFISVLVLIIIIVAGGILLYVKDGTSFSNTEPVSVKKTVAAEGVRNIQVKSDTEDVEFVTYSGQDIQVELMGTATESWLNNYELQVDHNNGELNIFLKKISNQIFSLSFNSFNSLKLIIQVPNTVLDQVDIETDTGNTIVNQVSSKEYRLQTDTGDIHANVEDGTFELDSDTGNILLQLQHITSDISAKTDTGNITVTTTEVPNDLQYQLKTEMGSQEANIPQSPGNEDGPMVTLTSDMGDLKLTQR